MEKKYFVMVYSQELESACPVMDGDKMAFWPTYYDAVNAMKNQTVVSMYGFEIHRLGGDCIID